MKKAALALSMMLVMLIASANAKAQNSIYVQAANLSGHFLGPQTILFDGKKIYAASDTAVQIVDPKSLKAIYSYTLPSGRPTAIAWCTSLKPTLCVSSDIGKVYRLDVVKTGTALSLSGVVSVSSLTLQGISQNGSAAYVGVGQTSVAATTSYVLMSGLNSGDYAQELKDTGLGLNYGMNDFIPSVTRVFNRSTGLQVTSWQNQANILGSTSAVAIFSNNTYAATTTPGCCGAGISIYNITLNPPERVGFANRPYANAVAFSGQYMFVGGEDGVIEVWNISNPASPQYVKGVSLLSQIGASAIDAAEIRSLIVMSSGKSFLIYGITSSTYGSSYPNLFKVTFTP